MRGHRRVHRRVYGLYAANGAAKVYAVDVGYGQLDWKLRSDARVVCLERTNARYLSTEQIPEALDLRPSM